MPHRVDNTLKGFPRTAKGAVGPAVWVEPVISSACTSWFIRCTHLTVGLQYTFDNGANFNTIEARASLSGDCVPRNDHFGIRGDGGNSSFEFIEVYND